MRFIINTTNLQTGGALQVALSLLGEWNAADVPHEFHIFLSPQIGALIREEHFNRRFFFYPFRQNPGNSVWLALNYWRKLRALEAQIRPDAVLTVFGPALWTPRAAHLAGFANGYYLFDRSEFIRQKVLTNLLSRIRYYTRRAMLFRQLRKEAGHFWVETTSAREALARTIRKDKRRIHVIGNTYSGSFRNKSAIAAEHNERFTFLYLSAYYTHKNFEIIPEVIALLAERGTCCTFILTLPADIFDNLSAAVTHKEYIMNHGPVNPQESYNLYAQCDAVLMPSLLETFSANFPEAMVSQKPILSSDRGFARNICADAALYFDPENPASIADAIGRLTASPELQESLIRNGNKQLALLETPASRAGKIISALEHISKPKNR
ncbi:MAG: glycosyltransferase [Chitinophagaceae bacterium]|nr:glycosyltransferase [Chitinophagaceae bacterium]